MQGSGILGPRGRLAARKIPRKRAPLSWRLRNALRWGYISGERIDYGTVGYRVITSAGVAFIVDDWDGSITDITNFKYHGCGTGNTAEASGDTALVTESTTALNPDSTRATGTQSQPSANILQSVGTLTFDAGASIVEHGLFSQAAIGGGTLSSSGALWLRHIFRVPVDDLARTTRLDTSCTVSADDSAREA